jgi:hypothetical protein
MKYEKHVVRVTKGKDFIMIDLLSPDSKTTTSTEPLGAIVLGKNQWKELKNFIEINPDFEEDLPSEDNQKSALVEKK